MWMKNTTLATYFLIWCFAFILVNGKKPHFRMPRDVGRERRQAVSGHSCAAKDNPCRGKGICAAAGDSYKCECHSNLYEGDNCEKEVQHCSPSKCLNGGTCEEAQGTFICNCPALYEGVNCEKGVVRKRGRAGGHFLSYESDIYVAKNKTYLILLKELGRNLRYEFSSGDGFAFNANEYTFHHHSNAHEFALKNHINSEGIPAEPRAILLVHYVYRKAGTYYINIKVLNYENLVMETKLPVVVSTIPDKCIPDISTIHGCGNTFDSEVSYFNAMKIILTPKVAAACSDTTFEFSWDVYKFTRSVQFPEARTLVYSTPHGAFGALSSDPYHLIAARWIFRFSVWEIDKENYERTHFNSAMCWLRVTNRPPQAVIVGGNHRTVDWAKEFIVDGSTSTDIDTDPNYRHNIVWTYAWSCWNQNHPDLPESFCKGKSATLSAKGSKLKVPAKALKVNEKYIFGLIASAGNRASKLVEQEITVAENKPLDLELRCKKNCADLTLPMVSIMYEVKCSSCEGEVISYEWSMIPGSSNKKMDIDWEKDTERGRNSSLLIIPANRLQPGDFYTFKLNARSNYLNREGSSAVDLKIHSDLVVGACSISPEKGFSLDTYFTVECNGFEDNAEGSNAALFYQFFQKTHKDDGEDLISLLDHDTKPVGDNMFLMPGDPKEDFSTTVVVQVSNHLGMNVMQNLTVKVEPLLNSLQDLDDAEGFISTLTSNSGNSILNMISSGNIPEAVQYINSLTELMSGIQDADGEQRTADIRNNLRDKLLRILSKVTMDSLSSVKLVSTALYKVASAWKGEEPVERGTLGKKMVNISAEMARNAGSLIWKISNALSKEAVAQEDFYSSADFKEVARLLMTVGEQCILLNRTDRLYRVDDDWEEDSIEPTRGNVFRKEKNEDYPNYKDFDVTYQDNMQNFRVASYWFFEGLKAVGSSVSFDSLLEEKAVELHNRDSSLFSKKFRASDLIGQKFGPESGYSGIKMSREYAEGVQSGSEDIFALEVTIITSNPIWWIGASPNSPTVNTEVVFANFKNLDAAADKKLMDSQVLKGVEIFLSMNSYEKEVVEASENSSVTTIGADLDVDDVTVHQIQAPDGASIILTFEPPQALEDKFLVVILKNQRPTRENFVGDAAIELPHASSHLDNRSSLSVFVRGSFNEKDPGFPQFFYVAAMPHPNKSQSSVKFTYKFSAKNIMCNYYAVELRKWLSNGCEVGRESTFDGAHCLCSHFSLFGAALSVAPNKVDPFSDVKLFLKVIENPVSVALVSTISILYILLMIYARRKDLRDKRKKAVIFLKDNVLGDSHVYLLTVYTGRGKDCGTTANVGLYLQGMEGISRVHMLMADEREILQSAGEDWFIMLCPQPLGELLNIRIWHDNSGKDPTWYCKRVVVRELKEMQVKGVWIFPVDRWLTVDGILSASSLTGTMPCCKVGVAAPEELRKWKETFTETTLSSFSDKHLWISIFSRPVQSTFTSCQRLSIATNLLMSTMLVSIMFYGVAKAEPGYQLDAGGFRISTREWLVALQSMVITTILNIPIALLFRYADASDFKVHEIFCGQKHHSTIVKGKAKENIHSENSAAQRNNETDVNDERSAALSNDSNGNNDGRDWKSDDEFKLPNWCRLIGWFMCIFSICISAYFVCLYGLSYGKMKSLLWLSAVLLAILKRSLLIQPVKIIFLSFFQSYAKTLTGPDEEYLKKNPLADEAQRNALKRHLDQSELGERQRTTVRASVQMHLPPKSGPPLSRDEIQLLASKEVKWRETYSRTFDILALVWYVIALHVVTYNNGDPLAWHNANVLERMFLSGHNKHGESRPELKRIIGYDDLFDYLSVTAIPVLHASEGYGYIPFDMDESWTAHLPSKLLGVPRLRQWRTFSVPCSEQHESGGKITKENCLPQTREWPVDKCHYGARWSFPNFVNPNDRIEQLWHCYDPDGIGGMPVIGKVDNYEGYGFVADLGRTLKNSRRVCQYVKDSGWIDRYTQALVLEFSMYNVDHNVFSIGHVLFERNLFGQFVTSHQVLSAKLLEVHFGTNIWKTVAYFIFISATLVLLWRQCWRLYLSRVINDRLKVKSKAHTNPDINSMPKWKRILIIVFLPTPKGTSMWNQLRDVFANRRSEVLHAEEEDIELKGLLSKRARPPVVNPELISSTPVYPRYPLSPPSFVEWVLIGMSICILVIYIMRNNAVSEPLRRLDQGAAANERHKFVSLQLGVNWDNAFKYALAFDLCVATSALWCTLPSFRRLPEKTLVHTGQGPLPTMLVCFGIMLLAVGCGGHVSSLLGSATREFSTISQSLSTLLGWALGVEAGEELLGAGSFGKILYCTFGIGCTIYVINLFLTIVLEEFEKTHREMKVIDEEDEKVFGISEFLKEFWRRKRPSLKLYQRKMKKAEGIHEELGQKMEARMEPVKEESGEEVGGEGEAPGKRGGESSGGTDGGGGEHQGGGQHFFSLTDYLRLRAGGHISTNFDNRRDEINHAKTSGVKPEMKFHHGTRKLSVSWLERSEGEGADSSKLAWISLEDDESIGNVKFPNEEDSNGRMKAMTAITVVLSQRGKSANRK